MQLSPIMLGIFAALAPALAQSGGGITCEAGSPNTIRASDIASFVTQLNAGFTIDGIANPIDMPSALSIFSPAHTAEFQVGSVTILLQNHQALLSTHVAYSSLAGAMTDVVKECCGTFADCIGGSTNVAGDTGTLVPVTVFRSQ